MKDIRFFLLFVMVTVTLIGCGGSDEQTQTDDEVVIAPPQGFPPPLSTWQWQLKGSVNDEYDVFVYDIDLFVNSPEIISDLQTQGRFVVCYFSAGTYEPYRPDSELFIDEDFGNALEVFDQERWLNTRSEHVREIMKSRMQLAKEKGCDAVEPDNMDAHINDNGLGLSAEDTIDYSIFIAEYAKGLDLYVGMKNNVGLTDELAQYYDFAINESCYRFSECHLLAPFYENNKAVFHVEYLSVADVGDGKLDEVCAQTKSLGISTLVLPVLLDDAYRFSCDD
ncbi:endo alpha-1,4 polygalactosaminidase [Pseudoalteromonas sp. SSDWG2]|uniref:endo alpha-1,4 polygalactosaminidase n=1 Tax=Pseudoalteromonas sp. SSDWG2 TaxID=3139391 RepID=UPI003BA905D3